MRLLFVVSEHRGGLTPERDRGYEEARARIGSIADAAVETASYEDVDELSADAVVLSGSADPWAAHRPEALDRFYGVLRAYRGPVFGICAGMQMLVRAGGGEVGAAARPTRGFASVDVVDDSDLLAGLGPSFAAFQSHEDEILRLPAGFRVLATGRDGGIEAVAADSRPWWGTQFHPEAWDHDHPAGRAIVERFVELAGIPRRPALAVETAE